MEIRNRKDLLNFLQADSVEQAKRHVYKYTDCGAWIEFNKTGIVLGSIVEGCDFGTATYPLDYPFSDTDYDARIAAIEKEADALWKWANEPVNDDGETAMDLGADAPDVDWDFVHLGQDGRSA